MSLVVYSLAHYLEWTLVVNTRSVRKLPFDSDVRLSYRNKSVEKSRRKEGVMVKCMRCNRAEGLLCALTALGADGYNPAQTDVILTA